MCHLTVAKKGSQNKMWRSTDRRIPPYGSAAPESRRHYEYRDNRPPPPRHHRNYSNSSYVRPGPPEHTHGNHYNHQNHHCYYHRHPNTQAYSPRPTRQEFVSDGRRPSPRERRPREEYVKLCSKCQNFSSNLRVCTNCGQQLNPSAKLFRSPSSVNAKLKDVIDEVDRNQVGPDLKPLLPATSEVLASIVKSNALNIVLRSPPSFEVIRMTPDGPVSVKVPEKRNNAPSTSTNNADSLEVRRTSLSTESNLLEDEHRIITTSSPDIIEILSPPPPPSSKDKLMSSPEKSNQPVSETASSSKSNRSRKTTQQGRKPKLIFIPSDDEEDLRSSKSKSNNNDNDQQPSPIGAELETTRKAQAQEPPPLAVEEIPVNTGNKTKRRKKNLSMCENPDDGNHESILEDHQPPPTEPTTETSDRVASSSKRITKTSHASPSPLKESVRLCHGCDSYSFSLDNCSLCLTAFKKKNPQVNPVIKLNSLTKNQLKRVHYASRSENMNSSPKVQGSPSRSPPRIRIADVLDHEVMNDPNLNAEEAQELPKDDVEPTLTRGAEEPQTGLIWEGVTHSDNNFSLITGSLILGPSGTPIRSDKSGGAVYVRQCPKCFKFGDDLTHCGSCKRKFTKKVPILRETDLTKEQRAESEKKHQGYLEEQLRIENEKIEEKLRKMADKLRRQTLQKFGLLTETDDVGVPSDTVPDGENDNGRGRKRKSSDGEDEPAATSASKRTSTSF